MTDYSSYTPVVTGSINPATIFPLSSEGNGSGVAKIILKFSSKTRMSISGTGKFYTDAGGTAGERTRWTLAANAETNVYIRIPSGTANLAFSNTSCIKFCQETIPIKDYVSGTANYPSGVIDIEKLPNIQYFWNQWITTGDITDLSAMTVLTGSNPNSTWHGSINGKPNLYALECYIQAPDGFANITGDVSTYTELLIFIIIGASQITGSLTNLTKLLSLQIDEGDVSGSINGLTALQHFELNNLGATAPTGTPASGNTLRYVDLAGNVNLTINRLNGNANVGYFKDTTKVMNAAYVNQILADIWANKDFAKNHNDRTIDLRGAAGSEAPTGQGITDKAALIAYKSPSGTGPAYWNILTR